MKTAGVPHQNYDFLNNEYNRELNPSTRVVNAALALVLRIARCAGVAPLRVVAESTGWRVAVSPLLAVFQRILITVMNMMVIAALILDIIEDQDRRVRVGRTAVTACVWIFDLLLVMTIASHIIYCGSARMENLMRILKQMQQINIDINNERSSKADKIGVAAVVTMSVWAFVLLALASVQSVILTDEEKDFNWLIIVMYTPYSVAYSQGLVELMLWGATVAEVRAAAAALNDRLRQLLNDSELTTDSLHEQYMIRRLAVSHEHIGEVMRQMNAGNGTFVLATLMATFLHLVITPYYLLLILNSGEGSSKIVIWSIFWIILHITSLLLTVEPCHCTQVQRETTKYLLSRLLVRRCPALVSRELNQFAKQIMLNDIKFAPLGIHALGRPYTATMLSGAVTYLVIILQFSSIAELHLKKTNANLTLLETNYTFT